MKSLATVIGAALLTLSLSAMAEDAKPAADAAAKPAAEAAAPAEMGTEAEAQAMSEKAAKLVDEKGEAAFETFKAKDGGFQEKDLYVFCMDLNGKILSHPLKEELIGKDMLGFDKYGDKPFEKMVEMGKSAEGKGWVEYKWPLPGGTDPQDKKSYIIKNAKGFLCGVGAYVKK